MAVVAAVAVRAAEAMTTRLVAVVAVVMARPEAAATTLSVAAALG